MRSGRIGRLIGIGAAVGVLAMGQASLYAWEPNANDLDAASKTGDFAGYYGNLTAWLNQKAPAAPAGISDEAMKGLLKDPAFVSALDQRQFIAKCTLANLNAFAKADPANGPFLAWILKSPQIMELFLEGVGPTVIDARDGNGYTVPPETLGIWQRIYNADPQSREGIYLRLAMATAIAPPGSRTGGAGGAGVKVDPLARYNLYKAAHKNKELFPSFDNLNVWEYTKVVSCHASDADITWAREMVNTWRPDLRIKEQVVESTREVWRRAAPPEFYPNGGYQNFKNVLAGGGKCGPRSSWAVIICQAFGIPAIGVGQPAHACVAAKSAYPEMQPQPGSAWKVHQGRGWDVSRLDGTRGPQFLEAVAERSHAAEFSRIEHLRWLASTLTAKEAAQAVMAVAKKIRETAPALAPAPVAESAPAVAEAPFEAVPGVIHVEAETFTKSFAEPTFPAEQKGAVWVLDCYTGGKQVYFQRNMKLSWLDYSIDVPATGTYALQVRVAVVNTEQVLNISSGTNKLATIAIPNTHGLWTTTQAVDIKLDKGTQTLRISAPMERGIAIRWFELKAK